MKRIGIVVKPHEAAINTAAELERWLEARGVEVLTRKNIP